MNKINESHIRHDVRYGKVNTAHAVDMRRTMSLTGIQLFMVSQEPPGPILSVMFAILQQLKHKCRGTMAMFGNYFQPVMSTEESFVSQFHCAQYVNLNATTPKSTIN